jgi:DNA processing protein
MDDVIQEKWCRVALWQTPGIGRVRYQKVLDAFHQVARLIKAPASQFESVLPSGIAQAVAQTFATINPLEMHKRFQRDHISVLVSGIDSSYPSQLTVIHEAPPVLYVKGELLASDANALAVVGTRKPTRYGLEVTKLLTADLASQGVTIVSGLAYGIDASAHQAALDVGGRTIAVLAHGLDSVYPTGNEALAARIVKQGALVSAFAPGEPPSRGHFVARDAWIAMLSRGVLVTEGAIGSGALITAERAQTLKKPVFAVPGPITSAMNHAPTHLLKSGAKLVTTAQDILCELGLGKTQKTQHTSKTVELDSELQQRVYEALQQEPQTGDELSRLLQTPIFALASELTLMELAGLIEQNGDCWRVA